REYQARERETRRKKAEKKGASSVLRVNQLDSRSAAIHERKLARRLRSFARAGRVRRIATTKAAERSRKWRSEQKKKKAEK
ncbi:unnamed protein product, partial [Amoebophrya sp. A25]